MAKKYTPPRRTGREFVTCISEFVAYTLDRLMRLPAQWRPYILDPIAEDVNEMERLVLLANRIWISKNKQTKEDFIEALKERRAMLTKAIRMFEDFDVKFTRLIGMVDIIGFEKQRLKNDIFQLINELKKENPDLQEIKIKMISHKDEIEYQAVNGSVHQKLALTHQNLDHWMYLRKEAEKEIGSRIFLDIKAIKEAQASL